MSINLFSLEGFDPGMTSVGTDGSTETLVDEVGFGEHLPALVSSLVSGDEDAFVKHEKEFFTSSAKCNNLLLEFNHDVRKLRANIG